MALISKYLSFFLLIDTQIFGTEKVKKALKKRVLRISLVLALIEKEKLIVSLINISKLK